MGLALEVGMLADLLMNDEEGAAYFREDMAKVNGVLAAAGLPSHAEPTESAVHSTDMYGYSGLHHLRRCAAHLHYRGVLPPPLADNERPTDDRLLTRYGSDFVAENSEALPGSFAAPSARPFDHLIMHSDAEGFYLPQTFERVLISGDQAYGWIGSSHTLRAECARLAIALELPSELLSNPETEAFFEAIEVEKGGGPKFRLFRPKAPKVVWRQHAVAAMMCAKLHCFTTYSIQANAALVFC
ncbi:MAG: hypothetical protein WAU68_04480 [Vitreimonas sp.]